MDYRQHAVHIRQDLIVPKSQDAVPVRLQAAGSCIVPRYLVRMLAAVDFNDQLRSVAGKICKVWSDRHLPPEMRSFDRQTTAKMPPQFSFGFRRLTAHASSEGALRRRHRAVRWRPGTSIVLVIRDYHDATPTPNPSPQGGGEQAVPGESE
jgi:hypothetical protein